MLQRDVLPNGVRIVTEQIDYVQSASIGIWVGVGARDETDDIRGISHVIEHMLFKGTHKRSAEQIAGDMDRLGGYLNAFTDKEYTAYYAKVLSEYIPDGMDILADMFLNSLFDPEEFAREKNVILEEIKRQDDQPEDLVHDLFYDTMWPDHSLGKPVIGTAETVSSLTSAHLTDYMRRCYTPDTIVIAAAGNLDHKMVVDMAADRFSGLSGSVADWRSPVAAPIAHAESRSQSKPVEQVQIVLGVPAYPQCDERRYPLSLLDIVLGGGMSSRLFQEIREKRGLAYSVGSYASMHREGGLFAVYAGTSPDTAPEVVDIIKSECARFCDENASDDELLRAKNQVRGALVMGEESMSNRMTRLGKSEIVYDRVIPIDEIMGKILAVTLDDIHATAKDILQDHEYTMAQVGPFTEEDRAAADIDTEEDDEED